MAVGQESEATIYRKSNEIHLNKCFILFWITGLVSRVFSCYPQWVKYDIFQIHQNSVGLFLF